MTVCVDPAQEITILDIQEPVIPLIPAVKPSITLITVDPITGIQDYLTDEIEKIN